MRRPRLTTIRGQLVLWYLGMLAVLLVALGAFQSVTLTDYLRSTTEYSLRHAAYQELAVLGPCYFRTSGQLRRNAGALARLLSGRDTAVTIVTPSGQTLASHGTGPPGASRPLRLPISTVRRLVGRAASVSPSPSGPTVTSCPSPLALALHRHRVLSNGQTTARSLVSGGRLLLVAVPVGPPGQILGYAILGRSLGPANATVTRLLLVFGLGAGAALVIAAAIALPIINRALRPLRRVAEAAEEIAAGNLTKRAQLSHSGDEIGRLGEAFDAMVDRLQGALAATLESEERMRRFLADASHELRTPTTVLRGASQVLLQQGAHGQPELLSALRDMHAEAARLARLVDDLLTLSRIDAGHQLAPEPVELRSFLHEFLDRYSSLWPERDIRVDEGELNGTQAYVDPEALRRVIMNLVDNAARYSRSGGAISITGKPVASRVSLAISDEGPGLAPADAAHVFDRFYRAARSRSRDSGGNGLGLAIVRGVVDQSDGTIDVDTAPDRGTTITVTLPIAPRVFRHRSGAAAVSNGADGATDAG